MNQAFIFVGTNIDRKRNYIAALERIAELGAVTALSSVYETAPLGGGEGRDFYNGALLLETALPARELKRSLREIEKDLGRVRTADRYSPRTIDLDLVLFNHDRIDEPDLHIPDPLILKRPFLALTLAEVAPDFVHPTEGRTLSEIARALQTSEAQTRLESDMTSRIKHMTQNVYSREISHA